MLNRKTKELQKQMEALLMQCGCDSNYDTILGCIETDLSLRCISQAYAMAVCYAASAHIENCYDTPDSECEDGRSQYITVSHYVKWMNKELSNPLLQV